MSTNTKGIYPNWISDKDIINQVLWELKKEEGKLPLSYFINEGHDAATQKRMKSLIELLKQDKLVFTPPDSPDSIEIDFEGNKAVKSGYEKYKKNKRLKSVYRVLKIICITLATISGITIITFLIIHFTK